MRHEVFPPLPGPHPAWCDCPTCEPDVPSVPRFRHAADAIAAQCLAGAAVGTAIAFAWDPHGAAHALLATLGWR